MIKSAFLKAIWEQRKVGELLVERNDQAPMSNDYPLMAFIANAYSVESVHLNRSFCARVPRHCILICRIGDGTIKVLLTVTEDRATLRSDLSADYGDFKAESDAVRCRSFLFAPLSAENHNALNLGFGQSLMHRRCLKYNYLARPSVFS